MAIESSKPRLVGYLYLIEKYHLEVIPNWHNSFIKQTGTLQQTLLGDQVECIYPVLYWPGDDVGDHLEFAIKYDGVNLGTLSALFESIPPDDLAIWINTKPTGKYARRIWFLFEFLTGKELPLPDLTTGNYVDLLESDRYYTARPGTRSQRHRVVDNLLGSRSFCPMVRRTQKLAALEQFDLRKRCEEVVRAYSPALLRRAAGYLYNKETKSSFEIEHIQPDATRAERFAVLLAVAEKQDFCEKSLLIDLQNRIVDPRFKDTDYRSSQNYIGQTVALQKEIVHYICPKPGDVGDLMDGLIGAHRIMMEGAIPAVIHAVAIAYGFVFFHPFEDGNGRIHRFLIHNILFLRNMVPQGLMFPVSAAMLKNPELYDRSLEMFSKHLLKIIGYHLDEAGKMTVQGETARWYRYIDMTFQAETLYDFIKLTIEEELVEELDFLEGYVAAKQSIQEIVDMPDRLLDLFIQCSLQNNGQLSQRKRDAHFRFLTPEELPQMELAVRQGFGMVSGAVKRRK